MKANEQIRQHLSSLALIASVALLLAGKIFTAVLFCLCLAVVKWLLPTRSNL